MDPPIRRKKSDKAKEKFERNGGYSQKHVRIQEAIAAKKAVPGPPPAKKAADQGPQKIDHLNTHLPLFQR